MKVKVIILRLLVVALIVMGMTVFNGLKTYAAETDGSTGLVYTVTNDEVTITGFDPPPGFAGNLIIPDTIDGKSVTTIGEWAFFLQPKLESVTIPGSIESMDPGAFASCINLKSVTLLDGVKIIGEAAFDGCEMLQSIVIPSSVESVGRYAFGECTSMNEITIPGNVISIGDLAFDQCSGLTNITILDGVESIGDSAFYRCVNLPSIEIPGSVISIGDSAFYGCSSLESVILSDGVQIIDEEAFWMSGLKTIDIPGSVTSIGDLAFYQCFDLTDAIINDGVESIGERAFHECSALTSITIPSSVTSIGNGAFNDCNSLTINCYENSTAHTYAVANSMNFNIIISGIIDPTTSNFDKNVTNQPDVTTTIIWNDSSTVTDAKAGSTSIGSANYSVVGDTLTIKKEYLASQANGNLTLTIEFDAGDPATLTIAISDSTPGSVNTAPARKSGVMATVTASVMVNTAYTLDLATIFEDADSDPLTYTVSLNSANPITTVSDYVYTPTSAGDTILEFKASDGMTDSTDTYMVTLTAFTAPPQTYALTITAGTGGSITTGTNGNYAAGTVINIVATASGNYSFNKWASTGDGIFGSATNASTTFTMPSNTVIITANFTYNGGGSSGGSGGSSIPSTPALNYKADVSGTGTVATLPITVNTGANRATVNAGTQQGDIILGGGTVVVTVPSIPRVSNYTLGIPIAYLSTHDGKGTLTFNTNTGSVTLPADMMAGISGVEGKKAEINISQGDKSGLPDSVKADIGDRPLIQLALVIDGKKIAWNNPDAPVTVAIPYTPTSAELSDSEYITIWYIDSQGNIVEVPSGRYDLVSGTVTFKTTHFSNYAVAYVTKTYDDLGSVSWAKKQIEVLASKGILKGTSEKEYEPQKNVTRADFLYFLVRTLGVDAKVDGNFDDVDKNAYYYKEIAIAKKLGITSGTGNNKFTPDANITRQDMMVLTAKTLKMLKKLTVQGTASDLDRFDDKPLVAAYAINGVTSVVKEGLIVGSGDRINPLDHTTRAETAVFLYKIYNKY